MSTEKLSSNVKEIEEAVRQLALQLEELKSYIEVAQNRVSTIASEIEEVRLAYETLTWLEKRVGEEALIALDRRGYSFIKTILPRDVKVYITLARDYVFELPIDKAKNILSTREKELMSTLRDAEADLKKLLELYNQINRKLQEYMALLSKYKREARG